MEAWLLQKQQIANDENYRDPTNLQSKMQKHAAFESELAANRGRVGAVTSEGEALIGGGHFAGLEIQARLDDLEAEWRSLQEASLVKRERLNDAYQVMSGINLSNCEMGNIWFVKKTLGVNFNLSLIRIFIL